MPVLNGLQTDYGEDATAMIVGTMITRGLYTINDIHAEKNPVDMELATNGDIHFTVGGGGELGNDHLALKHQYKDASNVYNFESEGTNAIALSPNDPNSTVYIGDAKLSSDNTYVMMHSHEKKLAFQTSEMVVTGPFFTQSDAKVDGGVFTKELNITSQPRSEDPNDLLGYAFRINAQGVLELLKYDSQLNQSQLVAHFGQGFLIGGADLPFSTYTGFGSTEIGTTFNGTGTTYSPEEVRLWYENGNDIYFSGTGGVHSVGINTSNPETELHVVGDVKAASFTDGICTMSNGGIHNLVGLTLEQIKFKRYHPYDGSALYHLFDGTAAALRDHSNVTLSQWSNDMRLSDFDGHGELWFDRAQADVLLTGFSNDITSFAHTVAFEQDVAVTSGLSAATVTASSATTSNLTASAAEVGAVVADGVTTATLDATAVVAQTVDAQQTLAAPAVVADAVGASNLTASVAVDAPEVNADVVNAQTLNALQGLIAQQVQAQVASVLGTLTTQNLRVNGTVQSDLLPDGDATRDLGGPGQQWRDLYLSGNTLNIGDMALHVDSPDADSSILNLNGEMMTLGVNFGDGTRIKSMKDIGTTLNDGEPMADFESYSLTVNTKYGTAERLTGSFAYDATHNVMDDPSNYNVYYWERDTNILPMRADGASVDTSTATVIKTGRKPTDVNLSFFYKGNQIGENVYITSMRHEATTEETTTEETTTNGNGGNGGNGGNSGNSGTEETAPLIANVNQLFSIRTLDPYSPLFLRKLKGDFHFNFNIKQATAGYRYSGGFVMTDAAGAPMAELNNPSLFNRSNPVNGMYTVDVLYGVAMPKMQPHLLARASTSRHRHLAPTTATLRGTSVYKYDVGADAYVLTTVHSDYGLFPSIAIFDWQNGANETDFREPIYREDMGWGVTPDPTTIFERYHERGWLRTLFRRTYLYLRYGDALAAPASDPLATDDEALDAAYAECATAASLRFAQNFPLDGLMETSALQSETRVVFSAKTFETLVS